MLKSLYVKNFTLIDELRINFQNGLNVITGETGAGKSILIDAIDLAFAARASKDQIKTGKDRSFIELMVKLPEKFPFELLSQNGIEIEDDNIIIISREILHNATRSRINGVLVTQNYVQEVRKNLLDLHSQHQAYTYINPKTHIDLLDKYGEKEHQKLLDQYYCVYQELCSVKKEYEQKVLNNQAIEQKIDFLKFQIEEIESAEIETPLEYEDLKTERAVLLNSEELKNLTYTSYSTLYNNDNNVIDVLSKIENNIVKASEYDKNLSELVETIATAGLSLKDTAGELRNYFENLRVDESRLNEVEERIDLLDKLRRKYGPEMVNVVENLNIYKTELNQINLNSDQLKNLKKKMKDLEIKALDISQKLSSSRKKISTQLSGLIKKELIKLEMPKIKFVVDFKNKENLSKKGIDAIEFLISTNPGEPVKPLSKVASGGEISRIMLAIKTIFARADEVDTVIFDEIDTGISGKTLQSVAQELAQLSFSHQILCITHQPIIAAMADEHLFVEKIQSDNYTDSKVSILNEKSRISNIAKLASGNENTDSINFAQKLLAQSKKYKETKCL